MPEIKHQFTGGKMNKDLDERLVPNGEYRDAMNIQVSTSEGSDVGTVQNILGNKLVDTVGFLSDIHTCVGSISDEKNDALYWFVHSDFPLEYQTPSFSSSESSLKEVIFSHYILEYKKEITTKVFVDTFYKSSYSSGAATITSLVNSSDSLLVPFVNHVYNIGDIINSISYADTSAAGFSTIAVELEVTAISLNFITLTPVHRILLLSTTITLLNESIVKFSMLKPNVLGFNGDAINGINIIDDMLFWTDGTTEPKKINIPRSIQGTNPNGLEHTKLIVNGLDKGPIEEKHITVIKTGPSKPPVLSSLTSLRQGDLTATSPINFSDISGTKLMSEGEFITITIEGNNETNFLPGDFILLHEFDPFVSPPETYTVRALVETVTPVTPPPGDPLQFFTLLIKLMAVSDDTPIGLTDYKIAIEEEGSSLFNRKFPRFACRYKYEDGEYSPVGPFSEVAFIPGSFAYHPTDAFNKGMVNNLKSLTLNNFIPKDIPKDVIQVDLLYKDENAPNIYTLKSIKKDDPVWEDQGTHVGLFGKYNITTENIYSQLPSNQLIRPWDNVPRAAIAQETVGNRLVYGNYLHSYDMPTPVLLKSFLSTRENPDNSYSAKKSIKSLRTYNLGIVYGDKYGRETPVFTEEGANQIVYKKQASQASLLEVEINSDHPSWATYYKVFVKETANEYYNIPLDRVYDAQDGNVWLSFPSVDRNKVDEDTYIILKKGIDVDSSAFDLDSGDARYKIVAIENEAPDYIKTTWTTIAKPVASPITSTNNVFGGGNGGTARPPTTGGLSFYIRQSHWSDDISNSHSFGLPNLEDQWLEKGTNTELYVSFVGDVDEVNKATQKYLITKIEDLGKDGVGTTNPVWEIFINKPFREIDDWVDDGNLGGTKHRPVIHKKTIENKPEFDGRFFVKIKEDDISRDNLTRNVVQDVEWAVVASVPFYYLRDSNATNTILGVDSPVGVDYTTNNNVTYLMGSWKTLLKFGGTVEKSAWAIDQVSYAGTQPSHSGDVYASNTSNSQCDFSTTQTYLYDNTYGPFGSLGSSGSTTGGFGTGRSRNNNPFFQKGLWSDVSGNHYLTLSYFGIEPDLSWDNARQSATPNWGVGGVSGNNSATDNQTTFVEQIKIGSKFRISGDPQTYTIESVSVERLYNHRGGIVPKTSTHPLHGNSNLNRDHQRVYMKQPRNKRLRFEIKYTIDTALGDDLITNSAIDGVVDATNAGRIEFLQEFDADNTTILSPNPAIFETEPKEDTDLDIYYEASRRIPTALTHDNQELFIPIGSILNIDPSIVESSGGVEYFTEPIVAISWGSIDNDSQFQSNIVNLTPELTEEQFNLIEGLGNQLSFTDGNGGISYAILVTGITSSNLDANGIPKISGFQLEIVKKVGLGWFNCWSFGNGVESNRVGDTYNNPFLTNGAKASTTLDEPYEEEYRKYGLIYSGLYNSNSGVNNLNQFVAAEKITKDINPTYGSIQKLYTRNSDLVTLCEDKVLRITANKDALYNADGNPQLIATDRVLGTAIPFSGEFGISTDPESFASESYRAYFADKVRGAIVRLSKDGLTPISDHGMKDWFRDNLKLSNKLIGSYDERNAEYNITLKNVESTRVISTVIAEIESYWYQP